MSEPLKVGDRVLCDETLASATQVYAEVNDRGTVVAPALGFNTTVRWDRTKVVTVVRLDQITKIASASPAKEEFQAKAEPRVEDFVGTASSLVDESLDNVSGSNRSLRQAMAADTMAALYQGQALHRIADSLEKIAGALMERDL